MLLGGGIPSGSFLVLLGDPGSGHHEFAYTSSIMTKISENTSESSPEGKKSKEPEEVCYISFGREKQDIIEEVKNGHSTELSDVFEEKVVFEDLSEEFFKHPIISGKKSASKKSSETAIIKKLKKVLKERPENSLIVLQTLTDLARLFPSSPHQLQSLILKLRKMGRKKRSLIYGTLSRGTLQRNQENSIVNGSDGALSFQWLRTSSAERKRTMHIEKFRGILNHVGDRVPIFDVGIKPNVGITISKLSKIKRVE